MSATQCLSMSVFTMHNYRTPPESLVLVVPWNVVRYVLPAFHILVTRSEPRIRFYSDQTVSVRLNCILETHLPGCNWALFNEASGRKIECVLWKANMKCWNRSILQGFTFRLSYPTTCAWLLVVRSLDRHAYSALISCRFGLGQARK